LGEEVLLLGDIPYHELPAYYQHAKLNIFASSCENCPNILLEALASGRPLLSSSYPPMPDFAGEAAIYFDPYEPENLADKLSLILDDGALQQRMGRLALNKSREFDLQESAARTWQALRGLV
jgi:glycosyltransferase involved in cell wall biosynthesis